MRSPRTAFAISFDIDSIILFSLAGYASHDGDEALGEALVRIAAPFLIALAVAWVTLRAWQRPFSVGAGLGLWAITVGLGMVLRRFVFDDGTATPFVLVATAVIGGLLVGWRAIATRLTPP